MDTLERTEAHTTSNSHPVISHIVDETRSLFKSTNRLENFLELFLNEEFEKKTWSTCTVFSIDQVCDKHIVSVLKERSDLDALSDEEQEALAKQFCEEINNIYFFMPF